MAATQPKTRKTDRLDHEAVVIGAGFSGIGVARALDRAGITDYVVLEEGSGVGGAWYWNTYPGVAVDIPSASYQFSFEQRSDWSRVYAPGSELRSYAEELVDSYRIRDRIRFDSGVVEARFDEERQWWRLTIADGRTITARHVISATGVLNKPQPPDIRGLDRFTGITMHTARWDHDVDMRGKRVGVIGTGASAVQLIPPVAEEAGHLTVFQRTPIWILPKHDTAIPRWLQSGLKRVPGLQAATRLLSQTFVEIFPLSAHYSDLIPMARFAERSCRAFLEREIADPVLRAKLTPDYSFGCKRPTFSNEYLATFTRPDVTLETSAISEVTENGVRTREGTEHPLDVLVLATGFKVFEPDNMPPFPIVGRGGTELGAWWAEHRYQAYEGVSVPGFPNYFMVLGPYGYNGSSYFALIENQTRHIIRCLRHAGKLGATAVEVRPEANERFLAEMLGRRHRQVFYRGDCSRANSYYFDAHGDVPFRPAPTLESNWRSARLDLDRDYRFHTPPPFPVQLPPQVLKKKNKLESSVGSASS
ncbi:MAG: flavin-containing monooxygenase [Pseudonocardia sp.]